MDESPAPPKSGRSIRSPAQLEVLARARAKAREVIMAKKRERDALHNPAQPEEISEEPSEEIPEPEPPVEDTQTETKMTPPPEDKPKPPPPEPREPPPKPPSPPPTPREPSPPPAPKPRFEMIDGYWVRT